MRAMQEEGQITPILEMFLNFGFMDVQMVGEDNANALYDLTEHLDLCNSEHVYTMYEWLKAIYEGRKEPSKNEFDLDYSHRLFPSDPPHRCRFPHTRHIRYFPEPAFVYKISHCRNIRGKFTVSAVRIGIIPLLQIRICSVP